MQLSSVCAVHQSPIRILNCDWVVCRLFVVERCLQGEEMSCAAGVDYYWGRTGTIVQDRYTITTRDFLIIFCYFSGYLG